MTGGHGEEYQPMPPNALRTAALWLALVVLIGSTMGWLLGWLPMLPAVGLILLAVGGGLVAENVGEHG